MVLGLVSGGPAGAATELTLSPASGPPGTEFVISGTGFAALPVDIRWGGLSGPVIATAMGPAFSVTAVVPDSPPNSHPVMAVVTDGNAVSTSSASFQVTSGEAPAPVDTTTTTTTTTTEVTTTTVAAAPTSTPVPEPAAGATGRATGLVVRGDASGVGGGVDGGISGGGTTGGETTTGGTATGSDPTGGSATPAGAGSTASAPATTGAAAEATVPTITLPIAGAPASAPANGQPASTAALLPGDGVTSAALAPRSTSQSAGAVSNPALLVLGLGLVFGGGVFLAVRNRHRA